jgi:NO-binding membrane sensor protein with MHYT domain
MTASASSLGESSLMLWALAAAVAMLAAHVFLGWLREAQLRPTLRDSWLSLSLAALTFGTGVCAAVALSISASPLAFSLGYRLLAVPALWLGAVAAAVLPAYWLMHRQNLWAFMGCGLLLGAGAIAVTAGWLTAIGFRPGIYWRLPLAAGAAGLAVLGSMASLWIAFAGSVARRKVALWRIGAAVLLGMSLIGGQELLMAGAGLQAQVGSVFKDEVPSAALALAGGVLVPLAMAVMALDLGMRRLDKRGGSKGYGGGARPKRRRRKQRIRTL